MEEPASSGPLWRIRSAMRRKTASEPVPGAMFTKPTMPHMLLVSFSFLCAKNAAANPCGVLNLSLCQIEFPARLAFAVIDTGEAMARVEVLGWQVFLRGHKRSTQPALAVSEGLLGERRQKACFHCAPDDAAAQQKSVDFAGVSARMRQRHADQPMISERVPHVQRVDAPCRPGGELGDLLLAIAAGRQIELVGFLRELRHARERFRRDSGDLDFHRKRGVELLERSAGRRLAQPLLGIITAALPILAGQG